MSTPPWARTCSPGPKICFERTPVRISMTLSLCSRLGSTAAPQMIRAFGAIRPWTISATFSASETLMSFPPVTFTRAPVAALMSTSIRGELIASSIASSARLSRSDSPRPIIATPPPFMIVLMSLKSRFTRPGFVMTSVIPLMPRISTSSATLNAAFRARRGTSSRSLSFGITTTVSAKFRSFSRPYSAFSARMAASAPNPDDLDIRPEAREDPLEFGVFRVDANPLRGGLRKPRLNARATHHFPDNGIHFSASGCPRKRMKQPRHSRKGGGLINVSGFATASPPPWIGHGGNSADDVDADAGLLLRGISSPDDLFRLDAGRDEHDAQRVFERCVDGRAPDDSRGRGDLRLDDLGDALRLGNRHVVPARDVDQDAVGGRHIDLEERRIDRLFDRLDGAVVADGLALAKADHRDAAAFHDRFDIIEVEVHEAGLRDDLRESLDRPHEHLVRELEREVQRLTRYQVQQFVVRDRDHRVGRVSAPLEAPFRALHPEFPFASERQGHNRDRQGAHLLREPGDVAAAAGARPATQAAGHEHDVRALDDRAQLLFGLARGFLADLWQRAGPEAFRNPTTEQDLLRGGDMEQVLRVRVASVQLGPDDALVVDAADRVAASTTEADNLDVRPHLAEHLFDLGVDPAVFKCGGTPFPGEHVF